MALAPGRVRHNNSELMCTNSTLNLPTLTTLTSCTSKIIQQSAVLPSGLPKYLDSPLAWDKSTFKDEKDYTYTLNAAEIIEIENALGYFKGHLPALAKYTSKLCRYLTRCPDLELYGSEVNCRTFPLPNLSEPLHRFALELHEGRGFFAIRGLNPANYCSEDNILIFLGISSYIGERRGKQDTHGHMIGKKYLIRK